MDLDLGFDFGWTGLLEAVDACGRGDGGGHGNGNSDGIGIGNANANGNTNANAGGGAVEGNEEAFARVMRDCF